jgi:hypothetical protein
MLIQVSGSSRLVQKRGALRIAAVLILCSLPILCACDSQAQQERSEARELLSRLHAVSQDRSFAERGAALDALGGLRLNVPAHIAMRDACRSAHTGLLEAEIAQASARKALAEASANNARGGHLSPQQASGIAAEIEHSNKALADAQSRFPTCERALRELTTKAH